MTRNEMIDEMIKFVESTPNEASDYHKIDMLLSRMERLGMLPPPRMIDGKYPYYISDQFSWEPEND